MQLREIQNSEGINSIRRPDEVYLPPLNLKQPLTRTTEEIINGCQAHGYELIKTDKYGTEARARDFGGYRDIKWDEHGRVVRAEEYIYPSFDPGSAARLNLTTQYYYDNQHRVNGYTITAHDPKKGDWTFANIKYTYTDDGKKTAVFNTFSNKVFVAYNN